MPRRKEPDDLTAAVGERIRELRQESGMSLEQLAEQSEGSKGHLSNIERGLVRPNIQTLKQVADGLRVKPLDLMTFPRKSLREKLVDLTRHLSTTKLAELVRSVARWLRRRPRDQPAR